MFSTSFYTSRNRYLVEVRDTANISDDTVGVFARAGGGENDDELQWPFVGTITCSLLNQLENKNHNTQTNDFRPTGGAYSAVFSTPRSELAYDPVENTQYLLNGMLYFRISAETTDHKPWLTPTDSLVT